MTNMMIGAVAINGGVGVMEIRQPLPQAVESVAQAVEALAVNAHISLRELKNCVDKVLEKKIPGYKQLMEMNPVVAARATVNGATITAYTNGYAVYEADDTHTVLDVNRCGDYRYDFNDGTYEVVPAEVFEEVEWTVRLVMEGERRLENNRSKGMHRLAQFFRLGDFLCHAIRHALTEHPEFVCLLQPRERKPHPGISFCCHIVLEKTSEVQMWCQRLDAHHGKDAAGFECPFDIRPLFCLPVRLGYCGGSERRADINGLWGGAAAGRPHRGRTL